MKKYFGGGQVNPCFICGQRATTTNKQEVPTCPKHKDQEMNFKCACGDYLDPKQGKYGPYFVCFKCGNISYKKGLEINDLPLKNIQEL